MIPINQEAPPLLRRIEKEESSLRDSGLPRIGVICLRAPVEAIEALGATPVRIKSGEEAASPDGIRTDACSFCRSVPAQLTDRENTTFAAVAGGACCDQMRRLFDDLERRLAIPVVFFGAPRTWNVRGNHFRLELRDAIDRLVGAVGGKLEPERLTCAIEDRQKLNGLVLQLREDALLSGRDLHQIAASSLPAADLLRILNEDSPSLKRQVGVRIGLLGSIPDARLMDLIAETGASVAADATCLGDRVFLDPDPPPDDPLEYLFGKYIEGNLCPHRRPLEPVIDYAARLMRERRVEGVIYRAVKYCHPWGLAVEAFRERLDLPLLSLDDDLASPTAANLRTRIGAFVEMLEMRRRG